MAKFTYRPQLVPLDPVDRIPSGSGVQLEIDSHDDILDIVARLRARRDLDQSEATALALGLKTLGWVLLRKKAAPFYAGLLAQLGVIIKTLKTG